MNKESAFAASLLFLLFFATVGRTSAQIETPSPGVSPGNEFTYDFSVFWSSDNQTAKPPAYLIEDNKTKTIRITITQVEGLMVLLNITSRFENGTEKPPSEDFVNIMSGSSLNAFGLIVSPNLLKDNIVYPLGNVNFTINETTTRTYPFGERETAHYTANSTESADYAYFFKDIYFDRKTGVMLEYYTEWVSSSSTNEKTTLLWKIKEFDLRTTGGTLDYWPLIAAGVSVVAVLLVIVVFLRKRRKRGRKRRK
jgi:hypothetical protein